jgi:hypothetical protein
MGKILLVDNSDSRASKIEKLHHNPAQDVAFRSIRPTSWHASGPGRSIRLPGVLSAVISLISAPPWSLRQQAPHWIPGVPAVPGAPDATGAGRPGRSARRLSRRNAKNDAGRNESCRKSRAASPKERRNTLFSPGNYCENHMCCGYNSRERYGSSHSDTSCDLATRRYRMLGDHGIPGSRTC